MYYLCYVIVVGFIVVVYLGMLLFIWVCCCLFGHVVYLGMLLFIWVCCCLFGHVVVYLGMLLFIWVRCLFGYVVIWVCCCLFGYVVVYLGMLLLFSWWVSGRGTLFVRMTSGMIADFKTKRRRPGCECRCACKRVRGCRFVSAYLCVRVEVCMCVSARVCVFTCTCLNAYVGFWLYVGVSVVYVRACL